MGTNLAVTDGTNAWGFPDMDPSVGQPTQGWASGTTFNPYTPATPATAATPNTASTPATPQTPASPTLPLPMSYFRTDIGGYNPIQYANQQGVQSVGNFLGPTATFGQTSVQGPNAPVAQSLVNWGGQNHNTGLVQNLINQYGETQARQMMEAERAYAQRNGGGNWTLRNDASSDAYVPTPNLFASPVSASAATTPNVQSVLPTNTNSVNNSPSTNSPSNTLASLFGLVGQPNISQNPMVQLLLLMLMGGGMQSAPPMNQSAQAQTPRRTPQYPLFY